MHFLIFILTEAALFYFLRSSLSKGSLRPFPDFAIMYIIYLELVLYLEVEGYIYYGFIETYTSYSFIEYYWQTSVILAVYGWGASLTKPRSLVKIDYRQIISEIQISNQALLILAIVIYAYISYQFAVSRMDIIWKNRIYLEMTNPDVLKHPSALSPLFLRLIMPMSLITTMTIFLLYFRKNPMWSIFLPAFLWQFVYQLGAHSRTSALMAAVGLLFATLFGRRVPAAVMTLVMALCLFSSLEGRSSGLNGISQVPRVFEHAYNGATKNLGEVMANSGEGIFSVTETWVYRPTFTNRYIYNSFSPLVSAIDGWDKISDSDEIPLALYAPMSAVEELFSFGIGFVILYFATQFYASYVTNKAINKKPGMLPLILNAMVAMGFMQEWAYSVRSGYRFYLYALAGCAFL